MSGFVAFVSAHPFAVTAAFIGVPYVLGFIALQKKCFRKSITKGLTRFYFRPMAPCVILFQKFVKRNRSPTKIADGVYLGTFPSATLGNVKHLHEKLKVLLVVIIIIIYVWPAF